MKNKKNNKSQELLGGQALIEGVMMKGSQKVGYAVYNPENQLITKVEKHESWSKKYRFLGWPFIRGFVNLLEMLKLGIAALNYSTAIALPEEDNKKNSSKTEFIFSLLLSLVAVFILFGFIPAAGFRYLEKFTENTLLLNVAEGSIRLSVFFIYLLLINLSKDIRRVFGFHGAEHATVHAYEAGEELTVSNVKKHTPLHPRCGTSFLMVVLLTSIIVYSFLGKPSLGERLMYKVVLLPIISGVSYEFIRLVNKAPSAVINFLLWPGLLMQKLTTRKPDDKMIKAAIAAINLAK